MSDLLYLYGITRAEASPPVGLLALRHGDLAALCARVSPLEFADAAALGLRLSDPAYVVPLAERHEATLRAARRLSPVLPARLCTLFSSEAALRSLLDAQAPRLRARLSRIEGREEYAVKLYCDHARLRAVLAQRGAVPLEEQALSAGMRYLARRRREERATAQADARCEAVVNEVLAALFPYVDALRERPPLPPGSTGRSELMLLNLALLCAEAGAARVAGVCAALQGSHSAEGFALQRGGPFTPYSFAAYDPDDSAQGDDADDPDDDDTSDDLSDGAGLRGAPKEARDVLPA